MQVFYWTGAGAPWVYAHGPADIPPHAVALKVVGKNDADVFARWATAVGAAVMRGASVTRVAG